MTFATHRVSLSGRGCGVYQIAADRAARSRAENPIMTQTSTPEAGHHHTPGEVRHFLHLESTGGVFLMVATVIALILANSPARDVVYDFWHAHAVVQFGPVTIDESLAHWVNDALMAIFFFVAGLEIKHELVVGELRDPQRAALPAVAALGGMVVPLIYTLINVGGDGANGWGIAGHRHRLRRRRAGHGRQGLPSSLKVFLLSLAIADDIGAVWYRALLQLVSRSPGSASPWARRCGDGHEAPRHLVRASLCPRRRRPLGRHVRVGVHATLAGVILGLMAPAIARRQDPTTVDVEATTPFGVVREVLVDAKETVPVTDRLIHILHPWTAFVILAVRSPTAGGRSAVRVWPMPQPAR